MAALEPGVPFPSIVLQDENGTRAPAPDGEALYVVFKTTCPTCEFAWPYLERIRKAGEGGRLAVLGVSQDEPAKTSEFNHELGSEVKTLYDARPWTASKKLGLTHVPTFFRVGKDGRIAETVVGFDRARMEEFARQAASLAGRPYKELFRPGEKVPAIKPG